MPSGVRRVSEPRGVVFWLLAREGSLEGTGDKAVVEEKDVGAGLLRETIFMPVLEEVAAGMKRVVCFGAVERDIRWGWLALHVCVFSTVPVE